MLKDRVVCARAPVRICDIGGWTDTHYYGHGKVTNFAINLYSYVRIRETASDRITINSENLDLNTEIRDYRRIEYDGVLDLLKAAVKRVGVERGLEINVRADAPPGCGTGTSASVAVAILAGLAHLTGKHLLPFQVARLAHALETEELGLESGVQDQYAAAFGGISHMEIDYPLVQLAPVPVSRATACQLEARWILVYLGSRKSSDVHLQVIENFRAGDPRTVRAHDQLKALAEEMVGAVTTGDMERIARIMNQNWEAQQDLHPAITNPAIQNLEVLARESGGIGFKVNGAGGGGSAVIMAGPSQEYRLKSALVEKDYLIFPCYLNFDGIQVWDEKLGRETE